MVKRLVLASLLCSAVAFSASPTEAREWTIVGPRALGMGGAGVAVANDASASYWNPAAFGFFKDSGGGEYGRRNWSATLEGGVGAQVHEDLGEMVDRIFQADLAGVKGGVALAEVPAFIELVNDLKVFDDNPDRALTIVGNAGLRVQVGHFGLGGYAFGDISARGDLDLDRIAPADTGATFDLDYLTSPGTYGCGGCVTTDYLAAQRTELVTFLTDPTGLNWTTTQANDFINVVENGIDSLPAGSSVPTPEETAAMIKNVATVADAAVTAGGGAAAGTIDENQSKLIFKGIAVTEVPLTYGRKINDDFAVGGNIKYMKARVYNTQVNIIDENTEFGDALSTALDDYTDSSNFGVDLGALYRFGDALRFGVVARNINSPSFDMKPRPGESEDSLSEEPQVRAGVAYRPFSALLIAADIDITENDTTVSNSSTSRIVSAGVEGNIFNFMQLRGGVYKNIANDDIGPVFTAGLGFNLWAVNIDFGAAMSTGSTTIDGKDYPKEVKAEFALSALF